MSKMNKDRREFLATLRNLTLLAAAGSFADMSISSRAFAQTPGTKKRFFVMIRAQTGWDVTLGLDPRVHTNTTQADVFLEYRPEDILRAGNIRLGPAAQPIFPYASEFSIVNGVLVSTSNISHDANLDYMTTGDSEGAAPDLSIEIANNLRGAIPSVVVLDGSIKRGSRDVAVSTVQGVVGDSKAVQMKAFKDYFAKMQKRNELWKAQMAAAQGQEIQARLVEALASLKDDVGDAQFSDEPNRSRRAAAVMAAAFISGAGSQGQFDINANLDTHSNHERVHMTEQTKVWNAVANFFRIFKNVPYAGGTLFDQTTFMVISEFSRTPALTAAKGKDHNPLTNSVLLAGGGVRGGQVIGESFIIPKRESVNGDSKHAAMPMNYESGKIASSQAEEDSADFQYIFPDNVAATVADMVGADRSKFASVQSSVKSLRSLVRS